MVIEGRIVRDGRWYLAEIPLLDGMTQSRTRKGALTMAADWVSILAPGGDVKVTARAITSDRFVIECHPPEALIALALRRRREAAGLSLAEVAERIGAKSRNAYARYEQGAALPTITKLAELFRAVDPEHELALTVA
jgi:DNA-binding XRE family transcriptional regulator